MRKDSGGSVFPSTNGVQGISMRDFFAGLAMQGLISRKECFNFDTFKDDPLRVARWAYDEADAMIKARDEL